ncbi:hypothetical protein T11_4585 [Trichinella zimbabwensis]|uniref:Uncharacterized protein n=1 Tax=Trichinella zimbabwensis TaxID=268475 RepID=A0A0V1GKC4_9BILA|nr:hypothetical protein T11_4585 [Trichinella zimbabwensis]
MLMHTVTASFFKISREIRNQERRGQFRITKLFSKISKFRDV